LPAKYKGDNANDKDEPQREIFPSQTPLTIMTHPPTGWPDDIPPLPWTFQVGKRQLVIGSANPDLPGEVDEIVFTMNYEDGFVNREIEMARAKFILDAVNNYYGQAGGGNVLRHL
jgi:hypothetical protein